MAKFSTRYEEKILFIKMASNFDFVETEGVNISHGLALRNVTPQIFVFIFQFYFILLFSIISTY